MIIIMKLEHFGILNLKRTESTKRTVGACNLRIGKYSVQAELRAFEKQGQVYHTVMYTSLQLLSMHSYPFPLKITLNLNFLETLIHHIHKITSYIISEAKHAVVPTHISSDCMEVISTFPSGLIPFTAPNLPSPYRITLNSKIVSRQLFILSSSKPSYCIPALLKNMCPQHLMNCHTMLIYYSNLYMTFFLNLRKNLFIHVRHYRVMIVAITTIVLVVLAIPQFRVI